MRLLPVVLVSAALAAVLGVPPAGADTAPLRVADPCGDAPSPEKDLRAVTFGYSADSFQVRPEACAPVSGPSGDWRVTVHLTSFSPPVQISGLMTDVGRYEYWSGMHFCAAGSCPLVPTISGASRTSGRRLTDLGHGYPSTQPSGAGLAYGAWRENLPDGTTVPSSISWHAEITNHAGDVVLDRVPDTGTATSTTLPPPRPTALTAQPGPVPVAGSGIARTASGVLTTDGPGGPALAGREVEIVIGPGAAPPQRATVGADRPYETVSTASNNAGWWTDGYRLGTPYDELRGAAGNAVARAHFPGDGVNAASYSPPFHAYLKAFVSLDLRDRAVLPVGRPVDLRGVVRPRGAGSVEVIVKPDQPGWSWSLLRQTNLVQGPYDSYYRVPWTPRTRGRYVLVTRWRHGTTDDGGVLNGQSAYRYVTVS